MYEDTSLVGDQKAICSFIEENAGAWLGLEPCTCFAATDIANLLGRWSQVQPWTMKHPTDCEHDQQHQEGLPQ